MIGIDGGISVNMKIRKLVSQVSCVDRRKGGVHFVSNIKL